MYTPRLLSFLLFLSGAGSAVHSLSIPDKALELRSNTDSSAASSSSSHLDQPAPGQLYKFEVGSYKLANVTWDAYAQFLVNVRYNQVRPIIARHKVSVWTETLTPPSARAIASAAIPNGWSVPQYDSVSTYYVKDPSILAALTSDPDWIALEIAAAPYVDGSRGTLLCGFETLEYV